MFKELKFSEARAGLTNVLDRVQSDFPIAIAPRKQSEEHTLLINYSFMHDVLNGYKFSITETREEDGSFSYWMETFDEYGYGETEDEAMNMLVNHAILYAEEYRDNTKRYYNAPNRRHHLPYVMRILMCSSFEEVKSLILADATTLSRT
ncbi:hypothetical protein ['Paenibacillus yunnanensis' Narsing Rao et al. 2020]|uniref:hypothetical protein n=1 Tax=Paenibacillus tengchongensis TaxID=2608684 RepID=UPI001652B317|nr:hypothetical protein [Paenibacillus tengchongensis]